MNDAAKETIKHGLEIERIHAGGITLAAWHKDGIVTDVYGREIGQVYRNGERANTNGEYEHITIVKYETNP